MFTIKLKYATKQERLIGGNEVLWNGESKTLSVIGTGGDEKYQLLPGDDAYVTNAAGKTVATYTNSTQPVA
ncbi:Uncharacterised protein [Serratia quinivorans]|uniref:hypothetical protein n=1 Tax=Serratia quinivorans TaxID=137545 RepID=UPI00217C5291|nr:hypothetical protein [Serratia quinivorans]CAI1618674.1 Uncharacterised protein [Serratia quinivorans]CAI2395299.1 Uncharacterised protein [Serratia quinivorans]